MTANTYTVAVRALCEFTAKAGDLDLRFTPSPTAQEGIAGHAVVAGRRGAGYESEVSLKGDYLHLHVRGRADGYDPKRNRLEEVKTFRGDLDLMPANHRALHWAQAKIYGWLLCAERDLEELELALVYFDIVKQKETPLRETYSAEELRTFFETQCEILFTGRTRSWPTAKPATRRWPGCRFPIRASGPDNGNWRKRCTKAPAPGAACSPRRPPASARPSARCSRC